MKKILVAAIALSVLGGTAASAQSWGGYDRHDRYERDARYDRDGGRYDRNDRGDRNGRYDSRYRGNGNHYGQHRRWNRGDRLPASYRSSRYAVDYRHHRLRAPPRGYEWRHVDDNYVLASVLTGLIAEVIAGR